MRAVKNTTTNEGFDTGKYGMIFCPDCRGSGKSFHDARGASVCKVCGGFGLIRKQGISAASGKGVPIELLK